MKMKSISLGIIAVVLLLLFETSAFAKSRRTWNNPQNERLYKEALKRQAKAYRNEAKALRNYDRELYRAQRDVRTVRNNAMKGALKGGAGGAAWGAAKGAGKCIYLRSKDYHQTHKRK